MLPVVDLLGRRRQQACYAARRRVGHLLLHVVRPSMVAVADPGRVECGAGAGALGAGAAGGVVLHVLVLAAAAQHPGALGHDKKEARAGAAAALAAAAWAWESGGQQVVARVEHRARQACLPWHADLPTSSPPAMRGGVLLVAVPTQAARLGADGDALRAAWEAAGRLAVGWWGAAVSHPACQQLDAS